MKCNYNKQFCVILLFAFVATSTAGRGGGGRGRSSGGSRSRGSGGSGGSSGSSGGGFLSRLFGGGKSSSSSTGSSTSHSGTSSYNAPIAPKQSSNSGSGSYSNNNYGWNVGNKHNSGHNHYYNSPSSSSTNWGTSSYNSPSYHPQPQNAFGSFHPVSSAVAPSYHFHRSTSYVPIYIPSSHTYIHHYHNNNNDQTTYSTTTNNIPPPPPSEPIIYKEDSTSDLGKSSQPTMIVGFSNMIVYGVFESEKHYVITINEDLDEDINDIPEKFLQMEDSSLFEIVTLKPTTTTSTTTSEPVSEHKALTADEFTTVSTNDRLESWTARTATLAASKFVTSSDKSNEIGDETQKSGANVDDVLNLYFGDIILR